MSFGERIKEALYASVDFGFRNYLFLTLTGRNDWSSTLPNGSWSYFYPSVGVSAILSDMFSMPAAINYVKLRGSYVQVGNDAPPYQTFQYFNVNPGGGISLNPTRINETLKPERTTANEIGLEVTLLNNRLGFDVNFYKTNSKDQLVGIATPPASGFSSRLINAGNIQNKGVDLVANITPVKNNAFSWVIGINYSKNDNKVVTIYPKSPEATIRSDFMAFTKIVEGKPYGEIYGRGIVRNEDGATVVGADGRPIITSARTVYLGNSRPKWLGGINNTFTMGDFSLSFLISARMGGTMVSFTDANMEGDGLSERTLAGRDGFVVDGVREDGSKRYHLDNSRKVLGHFGWQKYAGC